MQVVQARPTFVTPEAIDESLTTIVARSVLEAALQEEEPAELWFELAAEDGDDVSRLSVDLSTSDIEELLGMSSGDEIALTLDGDEIARLFGDADVEAHGMRGAIAIAVTSAALLAPAAANAALPQTTQQATPQTTMQVSAASTAQVSSLAATTQATLQTKAQVTQQSKLQVSKAAKLGSLKLLRSGFAR